MPIQRLCGSFRRATQTVSARGRLGRMRAVRPLRCTSWFKRSTRSAPATASGTTGRMIHPAPASHSAAAPPPPNRPDSKPSPDSDGPSAIASSKSVVYMRSAHRVPGRLSFSPAGRTYRSICTRHLLEPAQVAIRPIQGGPRLKPKFPSNRNPGNGTTLRSHTNLSPPQGEALHLKARNLLLNPSKLQGLAAEADLLIGRWIVDEYGPIFTFEDK